jgi:hypothetical protein
MTTLCTFNANNLFVRYRFGQTFPGDMSGKSAVTEPSLGYLPMYDPDMFDLFNPLQRDLTAEGAEARWGQVARGAVSAGDREPDRLAGLQRASLGRPLQARAAG